MSKKHIKRVTGVAAGLGLMALPIVLLSPKPEKVSRVDAVPVPLETVERLIPSSEEVGSVRPELGESLGLNSGTPDKRRLQILRDFTGDLSELEAGVLADELVRPLKPGEEILWYAEYFHSICCILREQVQFRDRLARVLATAVADPSRDQVVRDYALQHLATLWELSEGSDGLRGSILSTFKQLIDGDDESAAPALLSLHLLGSEFSRSGRAPGVPAEYHLPDDAILQLVTGILKGEATNHPSRTGLRLAALRIVSDRRMAGLLPKVREIAADNGTEHVVTKMAAIAVIGCLAESGDRSFLQSLDKRDPRIAGAVENALSKLTES